MLGLTVHGLFVMHAVSWSQYGCCISWHCNHFAMERMSNRKAKSSSACTRWVETLLHGHLTSKRHCDMEWFTLLTCALNKTRKLYAKNKGRIHIEWAVYNSFTSTYNGPFIISLLVHTMAVCFTLFREVTRSNLKIQLYLPLVRMAGRIYLALHPGCVASHVPNSNLPLPLPTGYRCKATGWDSSVPRITQNP